MNKIIMLIIFLINAQLINSQSIKISYTEEYTDHMSSVTNQKGFSYILQSTLIIDKAISKYTKDSIKYVGNISGKMSNYIHFEELYKNYSQKKVFKSGASIKKDLFFVETILTTNPTMKKTNKTKQILGLLCNSVETTNGMVIWYTTKLPYPDGPMSQYFPVNGVILAIESKEVNIKASNIEYGNFKINMPKLKEETISAKAHLSIDEQRNLDKGVVKVNKNTEKNVWFRLH